MRRLFSCAVALVLLLGLVPVASAEALFLTVGFLPDLTRDESIIIRGTANRGQTVAFYVNGELRERIIAGPSMDTYRREVPLDAGENHIVVKLEGTDVQVPEKAIVRVSNSFKDLNGHRFKDESEALFALGVVNGIGDGNFGPDLPLTRAQFAKLVVLGLKLEPAAEPMLNFADVTAIPEWARGFVATAVATGLINGFEDGTFRPDEPVSRAQVAVIGARALRHKGFSEGRGQGPKFADRDEIPGWARADVDLTAAAGLVGQFWGERFDANEPATRGLAAAVVWRLHLAKK